jgi:uncharacterized Rmd1/YagE family protein
VKLLNNRADVIGDLLDMLTDHLNGREMTWMTKIVIVLIVITSIVAAAEVYVKIVSMLVSRQHCNLRFFPLVYIVPMNV